MNINATLLIQVINFSLTYWFLNRFFFGPLLEVLNQKKEANDALLNQISNEESIISTLEAEKIHIISVFQQNFKKNYHAHKVYTPLICEIKHPRLRQEDLVNIQHDVSVYLVKKASHDF